MFSADGANHPKEDEKFGVPLLEGDEGNRKKRMLANDMENLPLQSVIFWGALLLQIFSNASGNGEYETHALIVLVIVYTVARVFYSVFYYFGLQPFRTISFFVAVLSTMVTGILMIIAAAQIDFGQIFPNP